MYKYKISVIIPTWNRCNLLRATLQNICNQTLPPYEIIVVDDNSTDGTLEMLRTEFAEKVICMSNPKRGPGAARNAGLKISTGDFIKFFDSDDVMSLNTLEVQVKKMIDTGKPYITGPYFYAYEKESKWIPTDDIIINYYDLPSNISLTHWMIWGLFITIPSMLFRKEFIDKIGDWPEDMITSEDWAYLWRIAMIEPFPAHTNDCAFIYRVHKYQSTGKNLNNEKRDREKFKVLDEIYKRDIEKGKFSCFEKLLFRNKFYQIANVTDDMLFRKLLLERAGRFQFLMWQYIRIKMKFGRIRSKTDWQPMHRVIKDKLIVDNYIELCYGK